MKSSSGNSPCRRSRDNRRGNSNNFDDSSKHENIFLCIYKEVNHTCKMDYSPRSENNILPLLKDITGNSKMDYSSKTVKELRHIARQRGMAGYSGLRKADLIAVISRGVNPRPTFLDDWLRGRRPERHNNDVNSTVNNSLMDAPVPVIETPIISSLAFQGQQ